MAICSCLINATVMLRNIERRWVDVTPSFRPATPRRIPIRRRVDIQVVADMVVWLALDVPDDITAERLNASMGWIGGSTPSAPAASATGARRIG